jgi:hypothetical protein
MRDRPHWDARCVPRYLVEAYVADSPSAYAEVREQAHRAAELGRGVRHVSTTFLPTDEVALHLFEAPSISALRRAGRLAALHYERIVEALEGGEEPTKEDWGHGT